jgi:type II secretory pathway pseudopilin PulG
VLFLWNTTLKRVIVPSSAESSIHQLSAMQNGGSTSSRGPLLAFTLIELVIVIAIIAVLIGLLLAAMEKARHKGYIDACASNLRQIGQAITMYSNENRGNYPRTIYVAGATPVAGTGATAVDAFHGAVSPNDVTAPLWLLARNQKLPTKIFICPYSDVNEFEVDLGDPSTQANFTKYTKNLGYSYANPYPDDAAVAKGYKLTSKIGANFPVMADLNPGVSAQRKADPFLPTPTSGASDMKYANSENHEREGENVLFGDGHVVYVLNPFCGVSQDNIYTPQNTPKPIQFASPANASDSILLPVD